MGGLEADRLSDGDTSRLFGFCKADSRLDEGGRSKVWDRLRVDVRVLSLVDRSSPVSVGRDLRIDFPGTKLRRAFLRGVSSKVSVSDSCSRWRWAGRRMCCSSAGPPKLLLRFLRLGLEVIVVGVGWTTERRGARLVDGLVVVVV